VQRVDVHDVKQQGCSALGNRGLEHSLQCSHWHTKQTTNPDCWNVAPASGLVGSIAAEVEIETTGLRDGQCFGLCVHDGKRPFNFRIVPLTVAAVADRIVIRNSIRHRK